MGLFSVTVAQKQNEFGTKAEVLATKVDTIYDLRRHDPVYEVLALILTHQAAEAALKATGLKLGATTLRNCSKMRYSSLLENIWINFRSEISATEYDVLDDINKERNRLQHDSILVPNLSTKTIICDTLKLIKKMLDSITINTTDLDQVIVRLGC